MRLVIPILRYPRSLHILKIRRRRTFREEYLAFLERFGVAYDVKYVFDSVADLPPEE